MIQNSERKNKTEEELMKYDQKFIESLVQKSNKQIALERLKKDLAKESLSVFNSNSQKYKQMQKEISHQVKMEDKYDYFPFVYGDIVEDY